MSGREHRGTIYVDDAEILERHEYPGRQFVLRLQAPRCAATATPGSFVHLSCDPQLPMRRPLSIMRADPRAGWFDVLYKIVGPGLAALSEQPRGARRGMRKTTPPVHDVHAIGRVRAFPESGEGFTAFKRREICLVTVRGRGRRSSCPARPHGRAASVRDGRPRPAAGCRDRSARVRARRG